MLAHDLFYVALTPMAMEKVLCLFFIFDPTFAIFPNYN
jgi:hypothetical protein